MLIYICLMLISTSCGVAGTVISKTVQRQQGTVPLTTSMFIIVECGLIGTLFLYFYSGAGVPEITPYSFWMATLATILSNMTMPLTFRILQIAEISVFKLFSTLGNLLLPYFFGVLCLHETVTLPNLFGLLLLLAALAVPTLADIARSGAMIDRKRKREFYVLCSLSCVLSSAATIVCKLHHMNTTYAKSSTLVFSMLSYLMGAVAAGLILLYLCLGKKQKIRFSSGKKRGFLPVAYLVQAICGAFSYYLNMVCSANLPATVLAVVSTGFSLLMTTLAAWIFFREKPTILVAGSMAVTIAAMALL